MALNPHACVFEPRQEPQQELPQHEPHRQPLPRTCPPDCTFCGADDRPTVLFLDVDGPLISYLDRESSILSRVFPLMKIAREADPKVIISSSWQFNDELMNQLKSDLVTCGLGGRGDIMKDDEKSDTREHDVLHKQERNIFTLAEVFEFMYGRPLTQEEYMQPPVAHSRGKFIRAILKEFEHWSKRTGQEIRSVIIDDLRLDSQEYVVLISQSLLGNLAHLLFPIIGQQAEKAFVGGIWTSQPMENSKCLLDRIKVAVQEALQRALLLPWNQSNGIPEKDMIQIAMDGLESVIAEYVPPVQIFPITQKCRETIVKFVSNLRTVRAGFPDLETYFHHVDPYVGLTENDAARIVERLVGPIVKDPEFNHSHFIPDQFAHSPPRHRVDSSKPEFYRTQSPEEHKIQHY